MTGHGNGPGAPPGGEAETPTEAALRSMLRDSVSPVAPGPGTLEYLHHAVPARRAQRRQAIAGACAVVVLGGVGLPLLAHSGVMTGSGSEDRPVNAGSSHPRPQVSEGHLMGQGEVPSEPSGGTRQEPGTGGTPTEGGASPESPSGGSAGGPATGDPLAADAPRCDRDQLGDATGESGSPDDEGRVYGSFRVVNTSEETCAVKGAGLVDAASYGRAGGGTVKVLDHTPGDAASGLPDPESAPERVVLSAGEAYTVKFAWIPEDCGGEAPVPKSAPGGAEAPVADQPSTGGSGEGGESEGPGIPEGGDGAPPGTFPLRVTHTPDSGTGHAAETSIAGAASCRGTVYRTGVFAAD